MKKLMIIAVGILLTVSVKAQDIPAAHKMEAMDSTHPKMMDCVMMKDGKVIKMEAGKTTLLTKNMKFPNGSTVMTDGTVTTKNGKTMMLKEGDHIMMNGEMMKMPMDKTMDSSMNKKMEPPM